jgi:ABC-type branched-subunit amino acid transport system permease subunit
MTVDTRPSARSFTADLFGKASLQRLAACLFGGIVLALMVGNQHGTQDDFHVGITDAIFKPRVLIFLLIGLVIFALMTFWPLVAPYVSRPGTYPLGAGLLIVIGAQTIMNWYDPLADSTGSAKFAAVRSAVSDAPGLSSVTQPFFSWLAWTLMIVALVLCGVAIIARIRVAGYLTAVVGVAGAVLAYLAHSDVVDVSSLPGYDHSLGVYADIVGFLVLAAAGITAALARAEVADTRAFVRTVNGFRPGLILAVVGLIWGLLAYTTAGWFGTGGQRNDTFSDTHSTFSGTGISGIASQYLGWLGWTLFAGCAVLTLTATYLRHQVLAWVAGIASVVAVLLTFLTLKSITAVAAGVRPDLGAKWKNLGAGGFAACMVFTIFAGAAALVIGVARDRAEAQKKRSAETPGSGSSGASTKKLPVSAMVETVRTSSMAKALLIIGIGFALFYPPTLTVTWQNTLVSQIGSFVLLAVGLNVVVGWAGLLDLGYIAFYEVGSYTTAYLTGRLPVKPPSWLHAFHSPLWSIPFAIVICMIAGVLLGAPTLRLRGDYLAIVTLGFGEIVQILSINLKGFTGGPQGPTVPHPHLHFGGLNITWGQDNLPYWYLLLIMLIIVIVLFYRLEGSRLGRAWAAIREDEVAAQASGVNTVNVKLLAFVIGASTSALAGWFFATQVGYFDPTLFTLQASILIVAYVVFGGMGSLQGAMAGAAVLTWLPQFLKDQVPVEDRQMWIGALVLAMMIFRPAGLLPAKRRKAELEGLEGTDSSETVAVARAGAM